MWCFFIENQEPICQPRLQSSCHLGAFFFVSPIRVSSSNGRSSSSTATLFFIFYFLSLEPLLLCFWDIRCILGIQRKIVLLPACCSKRQSDPAHLPSCVCISMVPASVLPSPEENKEFFSLVLLCSRVAVPG